MSGSSMDYHLKFYAVFAANSQLHRLGIGPMVKRNTKYKTSKSPFLYFVFRPVTFVMKRRNTKLIVFVIRMVVVPYAILKY